MSNCNLNEAFVRSVSNDNVAEAFYRDAKLRGFGLRVRNGRKSFFIKRTCNGKSVMVTIGDYPEWKCVNAREEAEKIAVMLKKGINPNEERKIRVVERYTLQQSVDEYRNCGRFKGNKAVEQSAHCLEMHLKEWLNKPLDSITRAMVKDRFQEITWETGPAAANKVMVLLKQIFRMAIDSETVDLKSNPVLILSALKLWNKIDARTNMLNATQIKAFIQACGRMDADHVRDYLLFLLMTGYRRNEALELRWDEVDLKERIITRDKNKSSRKHVLPITDQMLALLERNRSSSEWVFYSRKEPDKHMVSQKHWMSDLRKACHNHINLHDLRRTLAHCMLEKGMQDIEIKAILNHAPLGDVTHTHYVNNISPNHLRLKLQKVHDAIL